MKIIYYEVLIKENCPPDYLALINDYWLVDQEGKFVNKTSQLVKKYQIKTYQIISLIKENSKFQFEVVCNKCKKIQEVFITNQTAMKKYAKTKEFLCKSCMDEEETFSEVEIIEKESRDNETRQKRAVKYRVWESLSLFHIGLLKNIVLHNDIEYLMKKYRNVQHTLFWEAMDDLRDLNLIDYLYDDIKIANITFHQDLKEALFGNHTITETSREVPFQTQYDERTKVLKFYLTKNPKIKNQDSPLFSGSFTFDRDIVLHKGVRYVFGGWKRVNDSILVSITPQKSIYKMPKQKNWEW